jgi:predicted DNA-binding transcriptional regulator YafY
VHITYRTLSSGDIKERTIEPAYLFCSADGFWYTMSFCRKVNEWRIFAVDQILKYVLLNEPGVNKLSVDNESKVASGFGAFHGGEETNVVVRFSPCIRHYIERRKWHASETKNEVVDTVFGKGSVELRLRTTGQEGVKHWLKQWIPHMRVIEPDSLRLELASELEIQLKCLR